MGKSTLCGVAVVQNCSLAADPVFESSEPDGRGWHCLPAATKNSPVFNPSLSARSI
eukprot:TRINITY_DN1955_c0_g1_i1.p3 TRINITY_DN1955_c0_g1~~TRINITY_DN1955_c0_g1_i1.p3  ORF type:complete len:56 (-),score=5.03 TRINITY_DN1955_c0_g1_i1:39-206(-)